MHHSVHALLLLLMFLFKKILQKCMLFYWWLYKTSQIYVVLSCVVVSNRYLSRLEMETGISSLLFIWIRLRYETKMTSGLLRKVPTFLSRSWASNVCIIYLYIALYKQDFERYMYLKIVVGIYHAPLGFLNLESVRKGKKKWK